MWSVHFNDEHYFYHAESREELLRGLSQKDNIREFFSSYGGIFLTYRIEDNSKPKCLICGDDGCKVEKERHDKSEMTEDLWFKHISNVYAKHHPKFTIERIDKPEDESARSIKIGGLYKHYKNNKTYKVLHIGHMTSARILLEESGMKCVFYMAMYDDAVYGKNHVWARPYEEFVEKVDGTYRFSLLD